MNLFLVQFLGIVISGVVFLIAVYVFLNYMGTLPLP